MEKFIEIYDFYEQELDDMGEWKFASTYLDMTKEQREECERRTTKETDG